MNNKIKWLREKLKGLNLQGMIVSNPTNIKYLTGIEAFKKIVRFHFIESIWCYAIKREYYEKEKFKFKKDKIHEDFGLTPLIIIKANKVNSISYIGYNYYRRSGSIMNTPDYSWTKRKVQTLFRWFFLTLLDWRQPDSICPQFLYNHT